MKKEWKCQGGQRRDSPLKNALSRLSSHYMRLAKDVPNGGKADVKTRCWLIQSILNMDPFQVKLSKYS